MAGLTTREQLQEQFGSPPGMVLAKTIDHLDAGAMAWLAASTLMMASIAEGERLEIVLGGDMPGWARGERATLCLPSHALDAPERFSPGAGFGSVFLVPSLNEVMRVKGRVASNDGSEVHVAVEECYIHCGKALIRSDFWSASPMEAAFSSAEHLAAHCRFMGLATCDPQSRADLSPKGDPAGLMVRIEGETLRFADRPGNRRIDSFRNIIDQPNVALALLVPGAHRIAVVKGEARITDDLAERERFAVGEKVPDLVTVVDKMLVDQQESRALVRASPWPAPAAPGGLNAGKIAAGHLRLGKGVGAKLAGAIMSVPGLVEREMAKDYKKNLY
ncbi:pyridoxamine 5'-phosphate oxidase family protein [Kaistia defluvii]|uniref:Pyridoxine 5'-phosphate oxidase superfamily flavin-nucleotide-binding protein n=1 Tax=Kaistia defluvii TaxID=410841 RepID=A0ABV2QWQ3_9HYPH